MSAKMHNKFVINKILPQQLAVLDISKHNLKAYIIAYISNKQKIRLKIAACIYWGYMYEGDVQIYMCIVE